MVVPVETNNNTVGENQQTTTKRDRGRINNKRREKKIKHTRLNSDNSF